MYIGVCFPRATFLWHYFFTFVYHFITKKFLICWHICVCVCGVFQECVNPCCNATTCTLKEDAVCAHGQCCEDCKVLSVFWLTPYSSVSPPSHISSQRKKMKAWKMHSLCPISECNMNCHLYSKSACQISSKGFRHTNQSA